MSARGRWIGRIGSGSIASGVILLLLGAVMAATVSASPRSAARSATVAGYVEYCGGPAPGRCYKGKVSFCQQPQGCVTADRVAAINDRGRRVATQRLHHARFKLRLVPGHYTVKLLGDGKRVHGRVMQRKRVRARAHRTTRMHFFFAVP